MAADSPLTTYLQAEAAMGGFSARFITTAGRPYTRRLLEHSYRRGVRNACYENAFELALVHPELTYCEGRALSVGIPIEHAWCITPDGLVVDTTWDAGESEYHGVAFDTRFLKGWVTRRKRYAVLAEVFPSELIEASPSTFLASPSDQLVRATRALLSDMRAQLRRPNLRA